MSQRNAQQPQEIFGALSGNIKGKQTFDLASVMSSFMIHQYGCRHKFELDVLPGIEVDVLLYQILLNDFLESFILLCKYYDALFYVCELVQLRR